VVTVIFTVPEGSGGDITCIFVGDSTLNETAAVFPKNTYPAFVKLSPTIVTDIPPDGGPTPGDTDVTDGAGGAGK
jgi:hypothetical protein